MSKLVIQKIKDRQAWVSGTRMASREAADDGKRQSFSEWLRDRGNSHFGAATPTMVGHGVSSSYFGGGG